MTVKSPEKDTATTDREDDQESSLSGAPSARETALRGSRAEPRAPQPPDSWRAEPLHPEPCSKHPPPWEAALLGPSQVDTQGGHGGPSLPSTASPWVLH